MNCECNNKSNRVKPGIKHVYGNVLRMAIPLTLRTLVKDGDEMVVTDTDFIPSSDHPVRVVFSKGKTNYPIIATMDGNVAIVEDKGKIPVGTYDISVECYDDLGNPYRFKQNAVLYVADTTAEAGIDEEIEYEAQTWYLNAAVFLATTEIGEIGDAIDAKLDDVFGNVAYDANAKEIRFYNKGNSRVLATIDSRPFITDGTVADVYIDVSRQVLVVVLNEDAGGRMFSVPLYLIFNSYYKKDEVDSLLSNTVKGLRFDFSQELPLVVPVTKNGSSISSTVDFGAIDNAIREDGRIVVACVNNSEFYQLLDANRAEVSFSQVNALDGYQELLIVDEHNVWSMEDVDLGTGGGGGYEPPAGGIPKTDLAPAVQASLDLADSALQPSDLEGYATTDDVDDAVATLVSSAPQTLDTLKELADALGDDPNFATTMATQLGNKVDKETGKGLSTNDYTTAEKTKLAGLENYDDSALQTAVSGKVDKESGKSLMTDAERTKLQGIAAGAEVNVQPNWTQTNTSADDYIKNKPDLSTFATKTEVNAKQDTISDLPAIRSGAALGATALQSHQPLKTINGQSLVGSGNITVVGEKGDKGDTGSVTVTDGVAQITIVNDLTTGGTGDALSAEMGKYLGQTALVGMGTFAQAYVKSQSNHDLWCWMLNDMVDGEVIRKPIWHVGSGTFVDAVGSVVSIAIAPPAEPVFSLDDSEDVLSGSTLNVTFFGTLHYIIDGGTEQTTSTSPLALTLNADTDIEAWVEDSIGLLSQHVTKSYSIAIDHRLQFKIALTGDNSTEYVPITSTSAPQYNMTVDWGDGTTTDYSNNGADKTGVKKDCGHAYVGNAGDEFIITIRGTRCDTLLWKDNTCCNPAALVAILDNTLECGTAHGTAANDGFGANLENLSANALSNNTYGHISFTGTKLTSLPDGLLSHLTKIGYNLTDCSNMFMNLSISITASQMNELKGAIGNVTNFGWMFYGFKGTVQIPDDFFDLMGTGVVTSVWALTHSAKSGLTGDAKALYDVLSTKVTSSADTKFCFTAASLTNRNQVPNAWGGTAG